MGTRFFRPIQTGHEAHPASCTMGTRSLSQGVKQLGCYTDYPPPSNTQLNMGRAIPLPPLCVCLACNKTSFTIMFTVFRCVLTKRYDCCSVITVSLGWLNLLLTWMWRQTPLNYQSLISAASCKIRPNINECTKHNEYKDYKGAENSSYNANGGGGSNVVWLRYGQS